MADTITDFTVIVRLPPARQEQLAAHQINTIKRIPNLAKGQRVQKTAIVLHIKTVKEEYAKNHVTLIRVPIRNIPIVRIFLRVYTTGAVLGYTHMSANVHHLHVEVATNVKLSTLVRTTKALPTPVCAKS